MILRLLLCVTLSSCVPWYDKHEGFSILSPVVLTEEPNGRHRLVPIWQY